MRGNTGISNHWWPTSFLAFIPASLAWEVLKWHESLQASVCDSSTLSSLNISHRNLPLMNITLILPILYICTQFYWTICERSQGHGTPNEARPQTRAWSQWGSRSFIFTWNVARLLRFVLILIVLVAKDRWTQTWRVHFCSDRQFIFPENFCSLWVWFPVLECLCSFLLGQYLAIF